MSEQEQTLNGLTHARLLELLGYNEWTGVFKWRKNMTAKIRRGMNAGSDSGKGYLRVQIDGKDYLLNRLAWFYVTGKPPKGLVDHRDGNRKNNAFRNLRDLTNKENSANRKKVLALSGVLGVREKRPGRFTAHVTVDGKYKHLGTFDKVEDAQAAYAAAKALYHPTYHHQP